MEPILTVDIGAGTTDILVYVPETRQHYKAVAVSPIKSTAEAIRKTTGDLLITGTIMGGGAVSKAVVHHAQAHNVYMSPEAAKTINHDLSAVRKKGVKIVAEEEPPPIARNPLTRLVFRDLEPSSLRGLLEALGVSGDFRAVAGAVQDHGIPPQGVSSLDFRHSFMKAQIEKNPYPESFLFAFDDIPPYLTRMQVTGRLLQEFSPSAPVFMMDTGMAAVIGASLQPRREGCPHFIVVDIGNSHTLGACISEGRIAGFFEYHTDNLTPGGLEELLVSLGNGTLEHHAVIAKGGHGAYIRSCPGFDRVEKIVITGPRRKEVMRGDTCRYEEGAPFGDTMMAGTSGLLEAVNGREKLGLDL